MALSDQTFCWNGIVTTAPERTLAFFPEVLGWTTIEQAMGEQTVTMFASGGVPVGHVRPSEGGEPSWWNNYLRVADVDAAAASVAAHGGTVVVPPTDIAPGRFATVTTPSGAMFSLFREGNNEDTDRDNSSDGSVRWVDLHSQGIDADLAFLGAALGMKTAEMPMPMGAYHLLNPETATQAGAMASQHASAPSMWMAWVAVADVDATLARVRSKGGAVVADAWDAPGVGRLAVASDPAGVVFGVMA